MNTASTATSPAQTSRPQDTRFDRRLSEILDFATEVFAEKGYEGASMRDLSRLSGISLAGLYYYFACKEKLLYFIQKHTFNTIIARLRERLDGYADPEERIRIFVSNHVEYALERPKAMKVLSHEDDALKDSYGGELASIKREYYRICVGLVDELLHQRGSGNSHKSADTRTAVMALFGTMNWLYTWYNPKIDPDARVLSQQISDLFLQGIRGERNRTSQASRRSAKVTLTATAKGTKAARTEVRQRQ